MNGYVILYREDDGHWHEYESYATEDEARRVWADLHAMQVQRKLCLVEVLRSSEREEVA